MYNLYPPEWRGPEKPNLIQRFVAWLAGDPSVLDEWRPGPWPDPEPEATHGRRIIDLPEPEATPPEHRPDPDERQYPDPLQDPHACADCADRLDAVQWTRSTLEPVPARLVAHAQHTRSGFGVASLCGAPSGYTVPEQDSVTCSACKALWSSGGTSTIADGL